MVYKCQRNTIELTTHLVWWREGEGERENYRVACERMGVRETGEETTKQLW